MVFVSACGKPKDTATELSGISLASSDAQSFQSMSDTGSKQVDANYNHTFTAIFGGTDAASVQSYYSDRIKHFIDLDNSEFRASNELTNDNWRTPPVNPNATPAPPVDPSIKVGALNIGISLWLRGAVNQATVSVIDQNNLQIPVDSSRAGVVALGAGYLASVKSKSGQTITLPIEYRQAILVHEGRHSDCTGGLTVTQLTTIRNVTDSDDFDRKFPVMTCGHLHKECKTGDYQGLDACDGEGWGAYTVGAVYALAGYYNSQDPVAKEILKSTFIDYFSRMEPIDWNDLLSGKLNILPDMSSSGIGGT